MINTIYKKSDLPNKAGFKFLSVYGDGTIKESEVYKDEKGLHRIPDYGNVIGWMKTSVLTDKIK